MLRQQTVVGVRPVARRVATDGFVDRLVRAPTMRARSRLSGSFQQSVITQLALAMMLVVLAMVLYLQQAAQVSVHEFNISDLQAQQSQASLTNIDLQARMTELHSVSRITTLAISQLHMGTPDLSTALWVSPVVPVVAPPPTANSDSTAAIRVSRPLHWMTASLAWMRSQL